MKTAFLKTTNWLIIALGIAAIICSWQIDMFKQVNKIVEREKFETFLNAQIASLLLDQEPIEPDDQNVDKPDMAALQDYLITIDPELKRVPKERLKLVKTILSQTKALTSQN